MTYKFMIPVGVEVINEQGESVRTHSVGSVRLLIEADALNLEQACEEVSKALSSLILDEREGYIVKRDVP